MTTLAAIYESLGPGLFADKGTVHTYIEPYAELLAPYRHAAHRVVEIGVGDGHSLRMWRRYFHRAEIVGIDLETRNVDAPGCRLIRGDATDPRTYREVGRVDVAIDDGSHQLADQVAAFTLLWPLVVPGGLYVIEDIQYLDRDREALLGLHPSARVMDRRKLSGRYDDVLVVIGQCPVCDPVR